MKHMEGCLLREKGEARFRHPRQTALISCNKSFSSISQSWKNWILICTWTKNASERIRAFRECKEIALRCTLSIKVAIYQSQNAVSIHLMLINSTSFLSFCWLTYPRSFYRKKGESIHKTAQPDRLFIHNFFGLIWIWVFVYFLVHLPHREIAWMITNRRDQSLSFG